jgi:hypothetical protein
VTIYTDTVEQRRVDDVLFGIVYQVTLARELVAWANARKWAA